MQSGLGPNADNVYAPPLARDPEAPPDASEIKAARVAGALLVFVAVMGVADSAATVRLGHRRFPEALSAPVLVGIAAPSLLLGAVTMLLAIPLLRGNRRFRVLTLVRAALPMLWVLIPVMRGHGFGDTQQAWIVPFARNGIFFMTFVALLAGRPRRVRLVLGIVLAAMHVLMRTLSLISLLLF